MKKEVQRKHTRVKMTFKAVSGHVAGSEEVEATLVRCTDMNLNESFLFFSFCQVPWCVWWVAGAGKRVEWRFISMVIGGVFVTQDGTT